MPSVSDLMAGLRDTDPCVYLLRDHAGRVLYIGQTVALWPRLMHHRHAKAWFDRVEIIEIVRVPDPADLDRVERGLIRRMNPKHNRLRYSPERERERQELARRTREKEQERQQRRREWRISKGNRRNS